MTDDDGEYIDLGNSDTLRSWATKFDSTPEQIREAVQSVGARAADVELHLKGSHAATNADQEARGEQLGPNSTN